jgi:hypothetical protein
MARVPVIESLCPIVGKRMPVGASEHCSQCDRAVFNLNQMGESERRAFMRGCNGGVCVAYTVKIPARRGLLAATLAAAALVSLPAAADVPSEPAAAEAPVEKATPADGAALPTSDEYYEGEIIGAVLDPQDAEWIDDGKDAPPALPVVEDDGK